MKTKTKTVNTTTFTFPLKHRGGLERILLDGIQKTKAQITALEFSKKYFKGDEAELDDKASLLEGLECLYNSL